MALYLETKDLCKQEDIQNETVLMFLMQLRTELTTDVARNDLRGINLDNLNTRQQNALHNWIDYAISDRIDEIKKNMEEDNE